MNDKTRFLIIDDLPEVRQTVVDYLQALGFTQILVAEDGYEALGILGKETVDFVISDWEMPGLNGLELLRILKRDQTLRNVAFMIVTAPTSQERTKVEEAALSQVDAYLIKPFRLELFKEKLKEAWSKHKQFVPRQAALVVDDEAEVQNTVVEYLEKLGYQPVLRASDGEEAWKVLEDHSGAIDLIVSDWEMPRLTGIELLRRVRRDAELRQIPFVMMTSRSSVEHLKLQAAIQADVDQYLIKPFLMEDLRKKVAQVIQRSNLLRKVTSRLDAARSALDVQDFVSAERLCQHVLQLDPGALEAYFIQAQIRLKKSPNKGFDEAIYFVKKAVELSPESDYAYRELARVYRDAQSLEKALSALRSGLAACPQSALLHVELAAIQERMGRPEEAMTSLQHALSIDPKDPDAQALLAQILKRASPTN